MKNEKVESRVRTPMQMLNLEGRNNFVSCVTFKVEIIFKNQGPRCTFTIRRANIQPDNG